MGLPPLVVGAAHGSLQQPAQLALSALRPELMTVAAEHRWTPAAQAAAVAAVAPGSGQRLDATTTAGQLARWATAHAKQTLQPGAYCAPAKARTLAAVAAAARWLLLQPAAWAAMVLAAARPRLLVIAAGCTARPRVLLLAVAWDAAGAAARHLLVSVLLLAGGTAGRAQLPIAPEMEATQPQAAGRLAPWQGQTDHMLRCSAAAVAGCCCQPCAAAGWLWRPPAAGC